MGRQDWDSLLLLVSSIRPASQFPSFLSCWRFSVSLSSVGYQGPFRAVGQTVVSLADEVRTYPVSLFRMVRFCFSQRARLFAVCHLVPFEHKDERDTL